MRNALIICWLAIFYATNVVAGPAVLSYEQRPAVQNTILAERLETLLPVLMRETGIDLWVVIAREYNDDPVFLTLVPKPRFTARRTTMLVFHDRGTEEGIERLTISRYPLGSLYDAAWEGGDLDAQWRQLGDIIKQKEPTSIAINTSDTWPVADGLSHSLHQRFLSVLDSSLHPRIVSSENLVVRWLETRIESELAVWQRAVALARHTIAEAFSERVITPGATTLGDVAWFIRGRFEEQGLKPWFHPDVNRQWEGQDPNDSASLRLSNSPDTVIQRGDLLHTDVGLCYLGLCTDTQEMGYVLKLDETKPPSGLQFAMKVGNQWQDALTAEFQVGRTGNTILAMAQKSLAESGIENAIYTHPLGFFGHAPGPTIGMWDNQSATPGQGDWKLHPNTGYAIEGNVTVGIPEWGGQKVKMKLEQSAYFDGNVVHYLAGRQTVLHEVKH